MSGGSVVLRDFLSPATSGLEDLPPAFETRILPRPSDPSALPWLLAPSSPPWPVIRAAPPGCLIPPASPWTVVFLSTPRYSILPALPHPSIHLAPSGSSLPKAPPSSSVTSAPPRHSGSLPPLHSPVPLNLPRSSGSLVSHRLCGCSAPTWALTTAASSPSVTPMVSAVPSPPCLIPPSTPPFLFLYNCLVFKACVLPCSFARCHLIYVLCYCVFLDLNIFCCGLLLLKDYYLENSHVACFYSIAPTTASSHYDVYIHVTV